MHGPLHSDDAVTRVMHGQPVDFVPVALAYENLGPLQYLRTEMWWQAWERQLDRAGTDVLPVDYETYLLQELEIETEILRDIYRRPAWVALRRNQTADEIRGSMIVRRGGELFWADAGGEERQIPRTLEGREAEVGARWSDLWERDGGADALDRAAAGPPNAGAQEPAPAEVEALVASQTYDLAKRLAARFPDELPQYVFTSTPYNTLPFTLGFRTFMLALTEEPAKLHRALAAQLPRPSARLAAERRLGITLMHVEACLASADIISPRMYEEFGLQYDEPTLRFYEDAGFRTMLYFSGNLMPLLDRLKRLPFTALAFEEDRKGYGIDLAQVRRALGPDRVIFGNMDALFVERATDEELLAEVRRQISAAGRHNFILSLGSPLTPRTSLERVRLVTESTRRI